MAEFDEALPFVPDFADAYYLRWRALYQLGCLEAAISDLDELIHLLPDHPEQYHSPGELKRHLEGHAEAIADITAAIRLASEHAIASFHLSHPYNEQGMLRFELRPDWKAVWEYDAAQRLRPDYLVALAKR